MLPALTLRQPGLDFLLERWGGGTTGLILLTALAVVRFFFLFKRGMHGFFLNGEILRGLEVAILASSCEFRTAALT